MCNTTVFSSAGSIDCDYNETIGDSRVYLTITKDGTIYAHQGYFISENIDLGFVGNNYLLVLIILLTLVGMAFASPEWTVIIGIVAFVITGGLWLIKGMDLVAGLGMMLFVIIAAVILIMNKKLGKVNNSHTVSRKKKMITAVIAGLGIGFYDGFFGPGTGSFLILIYTSVLSYDFVVANANAKVVNLASNLAAVATFIASGKVNYEIAIPAAICGILGNLTGSHLVIKKGNDFIRPVFIFVLILLLIKIVWDQFR
jgi:uncharacterized membrane protein YfcA